MSTLRLRQDGVNFHAFLISTGHANNANQIDVQCEDGRAAPLEEPHTHRATPSSAADRRLLSSVSFSRCKDASWLKFRQAPMLHVAKCSELGQAWPFESLAQVTLDEALQCWAQGPATWSNDQLIATPLERKDLREIEPMKEDCLQQILDLVRPTFRDKLRSPASPQRVSLDLVGSYLPWPRILAAHEKMPQIIGSGLVSFRLMMDWNILDQQGPSGLFLTRTLSTVFAMLEYHHRATWFGQDMVAMSPFEVATWERKGRLPDTLASRLSAQMGRDHGPKGPVAAEGWVAGKVERFQGPYKFLSNFFWSELDFQGLRYPSVEHAFQAAKLVENQQRVAYGFTSPSLSFGEAKRLGRQVALRKDWKEIREEVMAECLLAKFENPDLRKQLLSTGDRELVDGHSGSPDLIWGYHIPSKKGENRLGILLMELRSKLSRPLVQSKTKPPSTASEQTVALFHLDWPVKCLHDGLPAPYAACIQRIATEASLAGSCVVLPRRKICIALCGQLRDLDAWEQRLRSEHVDVNRRGRPCRERMLVQLLRSGSKGGPPEGSETGGRSSDNFTQEEVQDWPSLCKSLASALGLATSIVSDALGPEVPELPCGPVQYVDGRRAVWLDGHRYALCLNEGLVNEMPEALLGRVEAQVPLGQGEETALGVPSQKPSIFGGKFARALRGLLREEECQRLIELSEKEGYGLAGSRGFNPFTRFAQRCLLDAPLVAEALTWRLWQLLPQEYPPSSGQRLLGVNKRLRFLKYGPGMHHADHTDCAHEDEQSRSFLTVQLYLNSGFGGGRTTFISDGLVPIEPTTGGAIVFDHELYHRGGMVTSGLKYALRMDVSYEKVQGKSIWQQVPQDHAADERRKSRTETRSLVLAMPAVGVNMEAARPWFMELNERVKRRQHAEESEKAERVPRDRKPQQDGPVPVLVRGRRWSRSPDLAHLGPWLI
eukprot:g19265.t1